MFLSHYLTSTTLFEFDYMLFNKIPISDYMQSFVEYIILIRNIFASCVLYSHNVQNRMFVMLSVANENSSVFVCDRSVEKHIRK